MRARLLALLSAVVVALLWASPRGAAYLCSMDGQRRAACCCAPDGEHAERDHGQIERTACCEVERDATSASPAVASIGDEQAVPLAPASWPLGIDTAAMASSADIVSALARGPPRANGPPPFLRNCRLLI